MDDRKDYEPCEHTSQSARPTTASLSFLNHCAVSTFKQPLPSTDGQTSARQKRRRTSPKDQAILEDAFNRDSKPDKAGRLRLVEQVALGEKEIQIWFQNRRQSSRRRSRPLLPHEIAQYHLARSLESSDVQGPSVQHVPMANTDATTPQTISAVDANPSPPAADDGPTTVIVNHQTDLDRRSIATSSSEICNAGATAARLLADSLGPETKALPSLAGAPSLVQGVSHGLHSSTPLRTLPLPASFSQSQPEIRRDREPLLKKASSIVRISMTSDGSAEVVTKDVTLPSPPRKETVPLSAFNTDPEPVEAADSAAATPTAPALARSLSGRSRDSRAWEFWCDKHARHELEDKAEKDASGSAADAIDLLRSTSAGRVVLGTIPLKRNSMLSRQTSSSTLKRPKNDSQRPLLQRARTSLGRLQGKTSNVATEPVPSLKYSESAAVYIPGNESDKENWSPGSKDHVADTDKPGKSQLSRRAALAPADKSEHWRSAPRLARVSVDNDEDAIDPETDAELAAFMRAGAREGSARSDAEDLDCVQGLLSLSQGNWK